MKLMLNRLFCLMGILLLFFLNPDFAKAQCSDLYNYQPIATNYTPLKRVRLVFHVVQNDTGWGNLDSNSSSINYIKRIVDSLNYYATHNDSVTAIVSGHHSPWIHDTRMRYVYDTTFFIHSTYRYNRLQTDNTYSALEHKYHVDWGAAVSDLDPINDTFIIHNSALTTREKDSSINVILFESRSIDFTGITSWVPIPKNGYIAYCGAAGDYWAIDRDFPKTLYHELGHAFGLNHPFDWIDCDQVYPAAKGFSNNVMNYWPGSQSELAGCQIGIINFNAIIDTIGNGALPSVIRDWCTYHPEESDTIHSGDTITWYSQKNMWGNTVIEPNASLTIHCQISLPKGAKITVMSGATLAMDGGTITNICGDAWNGVVLHGGNLIVKNGGNVKYADTVYADSGGLVDIQSSGLHMIRNSRITLKGGSTFHLHGGNTLTMDSGSVAHVDGTSTVLIDSMAQFTIKSTDSFIVQGTLKYADSAKIHLYGSSCFYFDDGQLELMKNSTFRTYPDASGNYGTVKFASNTRKSVFGHGNTSIVMDGGGVGWQYPGYPMIELAEHGFLPDTGIKINLRNVRIEAEAISSTPYFKAFDSIKLRHCIMTITTASTHKHGGLYMLGQAGIDIVDFWSDSAIDGIIDLAYIGNHGLYLNKYHSLNSNAGVLIEGDSIRMDSSELNVYTVGVNAINMTLPCSLSTNYFLGIETAKAGINFQGNSSSYLFLQSNIISNFQKGILQTDAPLISKCNWIENCYWGVFMTGSSFLSGYNSSFPQIGHTRFTNDTISVLLDESPGIFIYDGHNHFDGAFQLYGFALPYGVIGPSTSSTNPSYQISAEENYWLNSHTNSLKPLNMVGVHDYKNSCDRYVNVLTNPMDSNKNDSNCSFSYWSSCCYGITIVDHAPYQGGNNPTFHSGTYSGIHLDTIIVQNSHDLTNISTNVGIEISSLSTVMQYAWNPGDLNDHDKWVIDLGYQNMMQAFGLGLKEGTINTGYAHLDSLSTKVLNAQNYLISNLKKDSDSVSYSMKFRYSVDRATTLCTIYPDSMIIGIDSLTAITSWARSRDLPLVNYLICQNNKEWDVRRKHYTPDQADSAYNCTYSPNPEDYIFYHPAGQDSTICSGGSAQIGNLFRYGHTYSWTSSPSGFTSSISNPTVSPTTTTSYYLTETVTATGQTRTDTVVVTVNPLPSATVVPSSVCFGSSVSIGASSTSGHTYAWASNPVGFSSSVSNPSVSPISTTWYKLTETITATGCSKIDSQIVAVNPLPIPTAGPDTVVCNGSSVTIGGSSIGTHTYSWTSSPAGFTSGASNPSVSPTYNTTYYVTETITGTGCHKADTAVVHVSPVQPSLNSVSSRVICSEVPTNLSASKCDSFSFIWYKGAATLNGNLCNVNIADAGTYSFSSTYSFPTPSTKTCSHTSSSIVLTAAPALTITLSGTTMTISSTSTAYYKTFTWYKNGTSFGGTGTTQSTTGAGYYFVTGLDSCGNTSSSNFIKVDIGCGSGTVGSLPSPYNGYANGPSSYTTNTTVSSNTFYGSTVTISSGASVTITASDILMGSCTQFIVNAGCTLTITGSAVHSCSAWKGIDVKGSSGGTAGSLTIQSGATIDDAVMAVLAEKDAKITVLNSTFGFNATHLAFNNTSGVTAGAGSIKGNTFKDVLPGSILLGSCTAPITPTNAGILKMIYVNNVNGLVIGDSSSQNQFVGDAISGIHGNESAIELYNTTGSKVIYNQIDGALTYGIYTSGGSNATLSKNQMGTTTGTHPLYDIYMNGTDGDTIRGNTVEYAINSGIGMQFYQNKSGALLTSIFQNSFDHNHLALVVAPTQNPSVDPIKTVGAKINNPGTLYTMNLDIHCNAFSSNDVGIIGSGHMADQGSTSADQANEFYQASPSLHNNDWDVLWREDPYTGDAFKYYYYAGTGEDPNNGSYVSKPTTKYSLNYDGSSSPYTPHFMTTAGDVTMENTATSSRYCYEVPTMHKQGNTVTKAAEKDTTVSFVNKVYPNPFSNHFIVEFSDASQTYLIDVYDLMGRKVISKRVVNAHQIDIDAEKLAASTYTMTITDPNGKVEHYKMVKVKN